MNGRCYCSVIAAATVVIGSGLLCQSTPANAGIVERTYRDADGGHRYSVFVPRGEAPEQGWPVMLYLHGAGGRGNDGQRHLNDGPAPLLREGIVDWPILVVFPQCEDVDSAIFECWRADAPDAQRALRILEDVERAYAVNEAHRILAGWSMGGYGAWSVAAATPDRWTAVIPIAGGGDTADVGRLIQTPIWAIHGQLDQAILPERSVEMARAVQQAGGQASLTLLPEVDHGAWQHAFASRAVLEWCLAPKGRPGNGERLQEEVRALVQTEAFARLERPFSPELIIPHAVSIRLGERALEAISFGIPTRIESDAIQGTLEDFHSRIGAVGHEFEVDLGQMKYQARLERCDVEPLGEGRALLRLGISPLEIEIGQTQVSGEEFLITTNETLVRVGHRRPVWAEIEIRPGVEDHQLRLNLVSSEFSIPDDNWFIRAPDEINVRGEGLTADMVRIGIVGSLYQRREEFEHRIRDALPDVIRMIESSLAPGDMEQLAAAIWPLPVYRPRLHLRIDDLAVDEHGISVMLGLEADPAVGLLSGRAPRILTPLGPSAREVQRSEWLEFGVTPDILAPLAQMLIDAGAARIDLSDLPHPQLAELGTRQRLSEVVPTVRDLPADVNVKAELVLTQPFRMEPDATTNVAGVCEDWAAHAPLPPAPEQSTIPAIFRAVELKIQVLTRRAGLDAPWNPLAEFDVDLEQSMFGRLVSLESDKRAITVHWNGFPRVRVAGRYSTPVETAGDPKHATESPQPIDAERFAELFSAGWQAWTDSVASTQINTPDVRIGGAPLRIEQLHESLTPRGTSSSAGDESPETDSHVWWVATYLSPATRLLNTGTETINYQSHGPFDVWGPVRELPAGEEHSYRMPYPLSVRVIKPVRSRTMTVESGLVRDLATNR